VDVLSAHPKELAPAGNLSSIFYSQQMITQQQDTLATTKLWNLMISYDHPCILTARNMSPNVHPTHHAIEHPWHLISMDFIEQLPSL
jgi:hypothetical protein